ncbi:MAG TPA: AarF/UbiB family protein [Thermoanaerobaculia bacterium]|nr:AarF/UbiB family protein [Thermoanaerobaculia bacterium]
MVEAPLPSTQAPTSVADESGRSALSVPMARPQRLRVDWNRYSSPPTRDSEVFKARVWRVVWRMVIWLWLASRFGLATLWSILRRKETQIRRAERLRGYLEKGGATFIKIGQQLSMRIDLLPYIYCHELEKMLDSVPRFPTEQAIRTIEEDIGQSIDEIFSAFDPEPIASASIACVYQGILKTGEKVAVKVRRPGVGEIFAADLTAMTWVLWVLEQIIFPPYYSRNVVYDLRSMLLGELDFSTEARYMEVFKLRADKTKLHASAPRVFFQFSSRRVLTMEFVTGIFLSELLGAVENDDQAALAEIRAQNIDPPVVARRLIRLNRYGGLEALVFHADLHPGNVLVQPNNELILIDFGAVGASTQRDRLIWRRLLYAQSREDVGGMVQAAVALLEPLPPIDIDAFTKRMEEIFWQDLYAIHSEHAAWWERTTANIWLGILRLARQYYVPTSPNMLRMIRVALLADTIALRLDKTIDHYEEYREYMKGAGRRAKKRMIRRLSEMFDDTEFLEYEHMMEAIPAAFFRLHRILDSSYFTFGRLEGKGSFGFMVLMRALGVLLLATAGAVGAVSLYQGVVLDVDRVDGVAVLIDEVLPSVWYLIFVLFIFYSSARKLMYRLRARQ